MFMEFLAQGKNDPGLQGLDLDVSPQAFSLLDMNVLSEPAIYEKFAYFLVYTRKSKSGKSKGHHLCNGTALSTLRHVIRAAKQRFDIESKSTGRSVNPVDIDLHDKRALFFTCVQKTQST